MILASYLGIHFIKKQIMKKLSIIILLITANLVVSAQDSDKESRKEQKRKERARSAAVVKEMIKEKAFVLEANQLFDKYGQSYQVSSNINFIAVNGNDAVIQIGSNNAIGYNGVGGITVEGRVTDFEVNENEKRHTYKARINVISNLGNFDIWIDANAYANAQARINTNTSDKIRYSGKLVPLESSSIYVGNSTY